MDEEEEKVEDEVSGDNLEDYMHEDYKPVPELDRYEKDGIDDEEHSELDPE